MTGARQMSTLITQLHHTGQKIGVISMCYGIGGVGQHSVGMLLFLSAKRSNVH